MSNDMMKKLHLPISAVASSSHSGLCTLVQAVPLATLGWTLEQSSVLDRFAGAFEHGIWLDFPYPIGVKSAITLLVIAFAWHEYCTMTNYAAWHIAPFDTFIWFFAMVPESGVAIFVNVHEPKWFAFWMFLTALVSTVAYYRVLIKLKTKESRDLIESHFSPNNSFGTAVYDALLTHYRQSYLMVSGASGLFALIWLWSRTDGATQFEKVFFSSAVYFIVLFFGFANGIRRSFEKLEGWQV